MRVVHVLYLQLPSTTVSRVFVVEGYARMSVHSYRPVSIRDKRGAIAEFTWEALTGPQWVSGKGKVPQNIKLATGETVLPTVIDL
jgi:hypothetical protein